jgi:hypothetical protein
VVQSSKGYALLEWYEGTDPDKGDSLIGNFETYGFHQLIVNDDDDSTVRVYVEDYGMMREDALSDLVDKCDN